MKVRSTGVALICVTAIASAASAQPQAEPSKTLRASAKVAILTNSIGMKLAPVPAGRFMMGSPRGEKERDAEEVRHEVVIERPFYVGVYEVRQSEFATVMGTESRAVFRAGRGGGPDHPMEDVLWKDAVEFCRRLTARPEETRAGRHYRLPTEAEWEYACRAGTTTVFHFGDTLSSRQANFNGHPPYGNAKEGPYVRKTTRVGAYAPNAFGLFDMHGNVAEWCADWYDRDYYINSPTEDPLGPPVGVLPDDFGNFYLVVRGGSWVDDARACRSAYRQRAMHANRYRIIGFRVVCEVDTSGQ